MSLNWDSTLRHVVWYPYLKGRWKRGTGFKYFQHHFEHVGLIFWRWCKSKVFKGCCEDVAYAEVLLPFYSRIMAYFARFLSAYIGRALYLAAIIWRHASAAHAEVPDLLIIFFLIRIGLTLKNLPRCSQLTFNKLDVRFVASHCLPWTYVGIYLWVTTGWKQSQSFLIIANGHKLHTL